VRVRVRVTMLGQTWIVEDFAHAPALFGKLLVDHLRGLWLGLGLGIEDVRVRVGTRVKEITFHDKKTKIEI
jgi:hypothetical protein